MCFQAVLSCSSIDISSAGIGSSSGVGSSAGVGSNAGAGAASGEIDCVVTGTGFLYSATGGAWCASVRLGFGFEYSAHPAKATHAHTIIAPSRICMICPRLDEHWITELRFQHAARSIFRPARDDRNYPLPPRIFATGRLCRSYASMVSESASNSRRSGKFSVQSIRSSACCTSCACILIGDFGEIRYPFGRFVGAGLLRLSRNRCHRSELQAVVATGNRR